MTASPPAPKWFPLPCSPHRIRASRAPAVRITELPQRHHGTRGKCQLCWAGLQGWPWPLHSLRVVCLTYIMDLLSYAQNKWVINWRTTDVEIEWIKDFFSEMRGHASYFRLIRNEQLAGTLRRGCSFDFIPALLPQTVCLQTVGWRMRKKCLECLMLLLSNSWMLSDHNRDSLVKSKCFCFL